MSDAVQAEVIMSFIVSEELSFRIPVELDFERDDPYAVRFTFDLPGDAPVTWAFSRQLLLDGLTEPAGEGDIRIEPVPDKYLTERLDGPSGDHSCDHSGHRSGDRSGDVFISLRVGPERALFRVGALPLVAFLDRTGRLVPIGQEEIFGTLDAELDRILAESQQPG